MTVKDRDYVKYIHGYDEVGEYYDVGDTVKIYTPKGDVVGTVTEVESSDFIRLQVGERHILARYIFRSLAYGPHWDIMPDFDAYNVKSTEAWEAYQDLFSGGWEDEIAS